MELAHAEPALEILDPEAPPTGSLCEDLAEVGGLGLLELGAQLVERAAALERMPSKELAGGGKRELVV